MDKSIKRETDQSEEVRFFRVGDRVSVVNGQWFVTTREGEEGPFHSRAQAEQALARLVAGWQAARAFAEERSQRRESAVNATNKVDVTIWDRQIGIS
jgi:hypothetical protein